MCHIKWKIVYSSILYLVSSRNIVREKIGISPLKCNYCNSLILWPHCKQIENQYRSVESYEG